MVRRLLAMSIGVILSFGNGSIAYASGDAGTVTPKMIKLEGGKVYAFGNFANPDQCATSDVAVITPANSDELNRMAAAVMTAIASHQKIGGWLIGCTPTNWYPSAPQLVSIDFYAG